MVLFLRKDRFNVTPFCVCGAGVKLLNLVRKAVPNFFHPPQLEKYDDIYQIIGFNWV